MKRRMLATPLSVVKAKSTCNIQSGSPKGLSVEGEIGSLVGAVVG